MQENALSKILLLITVKFFRITIVLDMHRKSWPIVGIITIKELKITFIYHYFIKKITKITTFLNVKSTNLVR